MKKQKIIMLDSNTGMDVNDITISRKNRGINKTYLEDIMRHGLNIHILREIKQDLNVIILHFLLVKRQKA